MKRPPCRYARYAWAGLLLDTPGNFALPFPVLGHGMNAPNITHCLLLALALISVSLSSVGLSSSLTISPAEYEGRPHLRIVTPLATYHLDTAAGGFSRMLDTEGRDWIAFRREPLSSFPASAGAGYRGIPNLVFGKSEPDAGAGHPGYAQCESTITASNVIRSVTKSGRWAWTWTFSSAAARFRMERAPTDSAWWFLYEGTIGGCWSPPTHYWGTDKGGPRRDRPAIGEQLFDHWRWVYFGDDTSPRVLFLTQCGNDQVPDTMWYMGSENGGAITSAKGMVVFGFGRGPNATPLLKGAGQEFMLGFLEFPVRDTAAHEEAAQAIERNTETQFP